MNMYAYKLPIAKSATLIALHCSGADGGMWRFLGDGMPQHIEMKTPALFGAKGGPVWHGEYAFSLEEEAKPVVDAIKQSAGPVHIVGHSYGGAVALCAAMAQPHKIASLTLFEPSSFYLLRETGNVAFDEIMAVADEVSQFLRRGDARGATKHFVEYWGGAGSWDAIPPEAQAALMRWSAKVTLDFHALFSHASPPAGYGCLQMPCHILTGTRSPKPAQEVARILSLRLPNCSVQNLEGVGHMGPFTHRPMVARAILNQISFVEEQSTLPRCA